MQTRVAVRRDDVWAMQKLKHQQGHRMTVPVRDADVESLLMLAADGCRAPLALLCVFDGAVLRAYAGHGCDEGEAAGLTRLLEGAIRRGDIAGRVRCANDAHLLRAFHPVFPDLQASLTEVVSGAQPSAWSLLMVLDRRARAWDAGQQERLSMVARQMERIAELRELQRGQEKGRAGGTGCAEGERRLAAAGMDKPWVGMCAAEADGIIRQANDTFLRLVQYSRADLDAGELCWRRLIPEDDWAKFRESVIGVVTELNSPPEWRELIRKNGHRITVLCGMATIPQAGDEAPKLLTVVMEGPGRKDREFQLERTVERFRAIAELTNDGVWEWDAASGRVWSSKWLEPVLGLHTVDAETWEKRIHPDDRESTISGLNQALASRQEHWQTQYRLRKEDGEYVWVEATARIVRAPDGTPMRMVGAARDVSAQHRREEELRRLEERFATAFRANPDPMAITDLADGTLIDVNDAYLRVTGCSREETIGRTSVDLGLWLEPALRVNLMERLRAEGRVRNMEIAVRVRGGATWLGLLSADLVEIDGRTRILSVIKDITELRRLEEQLRQAQKMDAIGRLAGGIAHDFNNFLTIMHGYCEVLLSQASDLPEHFRPPVQEMRHAAERAAGLTRQLLAFSRQQILRMQVLDLNRLLRSNERMLRSAVGAAIDFRLLLEPSLGKIQADSSQIDQVILNLVMNARDATENHGCISIETRNVEYNHPTRFGREMVRAGRWILLSVKDDGQGMNDLVRTRIFEPFYTTKEEGKGTGLGLATVYGIVKQSGGYVSVSSQPGIGSTFDILLPRFDLPVTPAHAEIPSRPKLEGDETILLVEDEDAIRLLCKEVLEGQGYRVLAARDGQDALGRAAGCQERIHLLLTDLILPKMGGRALAHALRSSSPHLPVLYISGLAEDGAHGAAGGDEMSAFLQKPFSPARLLRAIRELLDRAVHPPVMH